jgi:4-amino-4-deoxychorismate lyase
MCQFIETIKVKNRELENIEYHNLRYNKTRSNFWGTRDFIDLKQIIRLPTFIDKNIYKCRIIYDEQIKKIEFLPYQIKPVSTLTIVNDDQIEYEYKYLDRSCFERLKMNIRTDDILIIKNGFVTDTSFSNIAFYDGYNWFSPSKPLLMGTKLNSLLNENIVHFEEIRVNEIKLFTKAKLINAMMDFETSQPLLVKNMKFIS